MAYNSIHKLCCNLSELKIGQTQRIIVIPIRDNKHSERAVTWYRDHIHRKGDVLYILNVIHPTSTGCTKSYGMISASNNSSSLINVDNLPTEFKAAKEIGEKFVEKALEYEIACKAYLQIDHDPGSAICHFAEAYHASLIIIGSRGLSKMKRTFLGSCSEYVLHHCDIPVLVVPPKKDQEGKKSEGDNRHSKAFSDEKAPSDRNSSTGNSESDIAVSENQTKSPRKSSEK